jgi:oxygen-independent coproporphyrinogen-3 oxidase
MAGAYISFPFCAQKCTYCNFSSGVFPRALQERYLAALHAEIESHEWRRQPETLYLGGGTPSSIEGPALSGLLSPIGGQPWKEATLEAAPGSITSEKVLLWRRLGINRISLGVQSFVSPELARTGRRHNAQIVQNEIALLRSGGIGNFNIDLIAGLAGQTPASWRESLQWLDRLEPPHVSVYMFEIDEDSRLGKELLQGGSRYGAAEAPSEELTVELYGMAVEHLHKIGIYRYEISNFARAGYESRHNLKYWRLEPYVGFGADAHSFDGTTRTRNAESPAEYVQHFERGESPCIESIRADLAAERFFVGLRLRQGIRPRVEEWRRFEAPIHHFVDAGLLEKDGETLRLTSQGVLLSNEVFQEFVSL